jgi:ribose 1,5-bisphosphokinase
MSDAMRQPGTLVLVVGGSGVGKDTVIRAARLHLADAPGFVFPSRYITRPIDASEDHVPVARSQFADLQARGAFALQWVAHDLSYGVPASIDPDLATQRTVVCNVSRLVVQAAQDAYLRTAVVEVRASLALRAHRLATRSRETAEDVAARLSREVKTATHADYVVENNGAPFGAVKNFVDILTTIARQ